MVLSNDGGGFWVVLEINWVTNKKQMAFHEQ